MEHILKPKKKSKGCDNPCYRPGAIWKTRGKIKIFPRHEHKEAKKNKSKRKKKQILPRNEIIMLLGYVLDENFDEHIEFLWKEKVYHACFIDSGFHFHINPHDINTRKNNATR